MKILRHIILTTFFFIFFNSLFAQRVKNNEKKYSILCGLNQIFITKGFNVEFNYWLEHFVIDYSHGFGLKLGNHLVSDEAERQKLNFNISHSIGVGIGYRVTPNFNIRLEPKLHIWEVYYEDQFKVSSKRIANYKTYTLGLGAYYNLQPFQKKNNFLKGLCIAPSIRWWPNIASSLSSNELNYFNIKTGRDEIHNANNIGYKNTSFFANISVGYTF